MKFFGVLVLCYAVLVVSGQDETTTTTEEPTTTKVTTTPQPQPPDTTTSPTTTTTTTTTTAATTVKPAPAPPAPVPPPPKPGPAYPLNKGKWFVAGEDKNVTYTCVILKGAMQINAMIKNKTVSIDVPVTAVGTGSCAEPQSITLNWNSTVLNANKTSYLINTLTLSFESNSSTGSLSISPDSGITPGKYGLENVSVVLHVENNTFSDQLLSKAVFQTPLNHSYSCFAEEVLKTESGSFALKIREIQLEAYRSTAEGHSEFSAAIPCPADDATDVVPIAVGAALAGLVVIVLIAYLVGRRRSRARGYQSV
ncbi:unnamed protein product [Orchesella dallaii]|uniref:Lysosome-associated membrane glycoprotein 2-like transmembrane domain-containing protein n=1 Tax=Orchesella dallaii TaxID=48710 RepID=A0ABP1Q9N3_9HEXA